MDPDFRVVLRDRAKSVLDTVPALKNVRIEVGRALAVPNEDLPFIGLWAWHSRGTNTSPAGTAPMFESTTTLHLAIYNQALNVEDCERELNLAAELVRTSLLTSPAFLAPPLKIIKAFQLQLKIDGDDEAHIGHAALSLDIDYFERFEPVITTEFTVFQMRLGPPGTKPTDTVDIQATVTLPPAPNWAERCINFVTRATRRNI